MLNLSKYSIGMGDRFGQQGQAQLRACQLAAARGVEITPVWNKSNREHLIVGSEPASVRAEAEAAVRASGWDRPYHVDADHIGLKTVDRFLACADFFTMDVAEAIGQPADADAVQAFARRHPELIGRLEIPGLARPLEISPADVMRTAGKYLRATQEAGRIYRHIAQARGEANFIAEVSMDETDTPQTPPELLIILAALADEGIRLQTLAPKFTGRFNKGVDYVGDLEQFEREFNDDLCVLAHAVRAYGLPANLKLSVHSGSDKFSLYPVMRRVLARHHAGVHLKTAGTTWLEEMIGLAEADGEGLALAKHIYAEALAHLEELCAPYAAVIDIQRGQLPAAATVAQWSAAQFVAALRHDPQCPAFNPHVRQLLHVAYKIAAKQGARYIELLRAYAPTVARNVTTNLFERHIRPLFLG